MRTALVTTQRQSQTVSERRQSVEPTFAAESQEGMEWAQGQRFNLDGWFAVHTYGRVAFLERKLVELEHESNRLKEEHITLHSQVAQLAEVAEKIWFARASNVSEDLTTFFLKFQALHRPLIEEWEKANKIRASESGLSLDDWVRLCQTVGDKALGEAHETVTALWWYCRGLKKPFAKIEQLYPGFKDSLETALAAKVQEIKKAHSAVTLSSNETSIVVVDGETVPAPHSTAIQDSASAFELYVQWKSKAIEVLQTSNQKSREENLQLEELKQTLRPQKINEFFLNTLQQKLIPFSTAQFHSGVKLVIQELEKYPERLQSLRSQPSVGIDAIGRERRIFQYTKGVALAGKICPALREMDALLCEIEKGCPAKEITDSPIF